MILVVDIVELDFYFRLTFGVYILPVLEFFLYKSKYYLIFICHFCNDKQLRYD